MHTHTQHIHTYTHSYAYTQHKYNIHKYNIHIRTHVHTETDIQTQKHLQHFVDQVLLVEDSAGNLLIKIITTFVRCHLVPHQVITGGSAVPVGLAITCSLIMASPYTLD